MIVVVLKIAPAAQGRHRALGRHPRLWPPGALRRLPLEHVVPPRRRRDGRQRTTQHGFRLRNRLASRRILPGHGLEVDVGPVKSLEGSLGAPGAEAGGHSRGEGAARLNRLD